MILDWLRRSSEGPGPRSGERVEGLTRVELDRRGSRRTFLKVLAGGAASGAASAACESSSSLDGFFQRHYLELDAEQKREFFARIEQQTLERTGVRTSVSDPEPIDGVEFAYALNLSACTGCRRCEEACAAENNLPDDPEIRYIRVIELPRGSTDLSDGRTDYDPEAVPAPDKYYLPLQCHHCREAPCVKACPVGATWTEPDGIVVVDYDWCIGCRFCQVACPYFARFFNFTEPSVAPSRINPDQGYLSNRPRKQGVVEKCTFCLHRVRKGQYPACAEACPVGARKFGNLRDPDSEVRKVLETKRIFILKEELGTLPRFYYFFD